MSHLAESEEERICLNNWGLRQGTVTTLERDDETGYELTVTMFIKSQHLDREIRVLAYQTALQTQLFGESVSATDVLSSLIYLPDVQWTFESDQAFWA